MTHCRGRDTHFWKGEMNFNHTALITGIETTLGQHVSDGVYKVKIKFQREPSGTLTDARGQGDISSVLKNATGAVRRQAGVGPTRGEVTLLPRASASSDVVYSEKTNRLCDPTTGPAPGVPGVDTFPAQDFPRPNQQRPEPSARRAAVLDCHLETP